MITYYKAMLRGVSQHYGHSMETPYAQLPDDFKKTLMRGSGETEINFHFWRAGKVSTVTRPFEGVIPNLERLFGQTESDSKREEIAKYMREHLCEFCGSASRHGERGGAQR